MTEAIAGPWLYQRGPVRGEVWGGFWDLKADRSCDLERVHTAGTTPRGIQQNEDPPLYFLVSHPFSPRIGKLIQKPESKAAHFRGRHTKHRVTQQKLNSHLFTRSRFTILPVPCSQSCPMLCVSMACSPPGSSVHRISQARILDQVAISFSRGISQPRDGAPVSCVSCIGRRVLCQLSHQ